MSQHRRTPRRFTLLDGGMGRELLRIGAPFRQPEWSALALLEGPAWVVQAHRNFLDAGADVITTNSYAIVPFHLGEERFDARALELSSLSGRLAREAAAGHTVAGSLPPLFGSYEPDRYAADRADRIIDPLVAGLAEHVDVWLGETLGSIVEAATVRRAIDRAGVGGRPLWISYTLRFDATAELVSGEPVVDAVRAAVDLGAEAVLFNCSAAASITDALRVAASTVPAGVQIGGYANRFVTGHAAQGSANRGLSALRDDLDPVAYREVVSAWLELGATLVGGCCGMTPDHIAALATLRG